MRRIIIIISLCLVNFLHSSEDEYYPTPPDWVFQLQDQNVCKVVPNQAAIEQALTRLEGRLYYEMWAGSLKKRGLDPVKEVKARLEKHGVCHGHFFRIQKELHRQHTIDPETALKAAFSNNDLTFDVQRLIFIQSLEAVILHELTQPFANFDYSKLKTLLRKEYYEDLSALLSTGTQIETLSFALPLNEFVEEGALRIGKELSSFASSRFMAVQLDVLSGQNAVVTLLFTATSPHFYLFDPRFPGWIVPGPEPDWRFTDLESLVRSALSYTKSVYLKHISSNSTVYFKTLIFSY